MTGSADEYSGYVKHPRFGRGPRITGLNPPADLPFDTRWRPDERIPNTAVKADETKQRFGAGSRTYSSPYVWYFDVRRICCECKRPFIFFAEEQKYWYEELRLPMEADCVRCCECRGLRHKHQRVLDRYQELRILAEPKATELIELISLGLILIESGEHSNSRRNFDRIRMWLNRLSRYQEHAETRTALSLRVSKAEQDAQRETYRGPDMGRDPDDNQRMSTE